MVKQISVFLENKEGRLAEVTKTIADSGINIRAMSIADTTDFGILRLIVNDPERASKVLIDSEFTVTVKEVLAVGISDEPGALSKTLSVMMKDGIAIEYMYAFVGKCNGNALVIFKVSDNEKAAASLKQSGIEVIDGQELYNL
ncbi:MAG TPA: ACT domain-containing protein [Ruminiclostridium sp.]|nr:ACT domain-containing protein [Ruminiclostridium sp.]